jgi:hypothetical protein
MQPLATRPAYLDHYRLAFNLPVGPGERGVANVEPVPGARTWGVLYLLTADDCARLDRTEGVHLEFYRRVAVEVVVDGAGRVPAFTYRSPHGVAGRKPSPRYLRLLVEGAGQHGLPDDYVRFLERFELALDERDPERQGL